MKKIITYSIIILLITIITAGATYAYLSSTTNSNKNKLIGEGAELNVVYTGGVNLEGAISPGMDKSSGLNTTVNIGITDDSVVAKANLYINVNSISSPLASSGFIWEVYGTSNGEQTFYDSGTFIECRATTGTDNKKCTTNDKLYIVNDYVLSTTPTSFTVYTWIDGNKTGSDVIGASFKGTIAAETEKFTGHLDK